MNSYPREPNPGDRISAQLIRDIIRCLRRITPLAGPGVKANVTPNGTHLTAAAATSGVASSAAVAVDLGCWKISTVADGDDVRPALVNKYFAIGGTVCEYDGYAFLDDFVPQGELEPGEEYTADDLPFVALVVDLSPSNYGEASVGGYATFADMQSAAEEPTQLVRPLYKLTHTGGIAIDFRNMPLIAAGEVLS